MSDENEPVSPEAVQNAQALANELATIEQRMGAINEGRETELFLAKQVSASLDEQLKSIYEAQASGARLIAERQKELDLLKEKKDYDQSAAKAIQAEIDKIKELAVTHEDVIAAMEQERDIQKEIADAIEEADQRSKDLQSTIETAAEALTGIGDSWKRSATGAFLNKVSTDGFAAALKDVGAGLKENFKLENIAGSIMMGFVQQTGMAIMALDGARSGFAKAMGTGDSYNSTISEVHLSTREFGVDAGEAAAATQAMAEGMAGFGQMSKKAQADLAGFNAKLGELGVSSSDAAKMLENTTLMMGMSKDESKAMGADLSALSAQLGISLGSVTADFNAVMGDLAIYGKEAPQVFKKLVGASQSLGISVDSLVGSMKNLDTVSGAASVAGKMNAALQGQFMDTNELLNASYEERILLIKKGLDASGKDFDSMSRAEKQMVAQSAGMKDVGELAKFMRKDYNELADSMEKAGDASGSIEEMEERAKKAQSVTDKWKQTLESLAIATEPLLDALHSFADIVKTIIQIPGVKYLMLLGAAFYFLGSGAAAAAWGAITAFGSAIWSGIAAVGTMILKMGIWAASKILGIGLTWAEVTALFAQTEVTEELTDAQEKQANASDDAASSGSGFLSFLKELLEIASDNWKGLLALGAAFVLIGLGVFIAAHGVAELVRSFQGFSAGEILAIAVALAVFGATMIGMMMALTAALPAIAAGSAGLGIFGGVMILLGIALVLAAFAFTLLVDSFLLLLPYLPEFVLFAGTLMLLAVAGMLMLPGGLMAMIGLILMAVGIAALGLALKLVSSDDLRSLADMMQGLGKVAEFAGAGIGDAVPAVKDLFDELEDMAAQISTSIWLFSALGNAFVSIGYGALMASMFLPAMVVPLLLIGAGVVVWADAMERLLPTLPIFFSYIPQWYEILFIFSMLAPVVFFLALSVSILAMTGIAAAIGLMFLAFGFWRLSEALWSLPIDVMFQFNTMLDKIESTTDAAIDRLHDLASAFWHLAYVMRYMDRYTDTMFNVGYMLEHTGHAAKEASKLTPTVIDNVGGLVEAAEDYSNVRYSYMNYVYGDPLAKLLAASTQSSDAKNNTSTASSSGTGTGTTVVLELDGRELGRTVEKLLGRRNKLTTVS